MILYRPTDGDPLTSPVHWRERTCFVMTQLGETTPRLVEDIRAHLTSVLSKHEIVTIDAGDVITGKDFLLKIWDIAISVPIGIAIIHQEMSSQTMGNIFYELGWMHAYGKETLVVKSPEVRVPSDFVRTEYVEYNARFEEQLERFVESLSDRAKYFALMAEQLERNPLLAIDYLRRAYLLSKDDAHRKRATEMLGEAGVEGRAKNSVEMLLATF